MKECQEALHKDEGRHTHVGGEHTQTLCTHSTRKEDARDSEAGS